MRSRARPSDSTAEAVRVMRDAHKQIVPPSNVPLEQGDIAFFANIIEEFARADWSAHQLELAALLARSMNDLAVEQMMMRDEGAILQGEKGAITNPRKNIIHLHLNNILGLRRTLALHAASRGETEHLAKRVATAKALQRQAPGQDEELIARA